MENGIEMDQPQRLAPRYRAIVLGAMLVPVNVYFLLYMEVGFRNMSNAGAGPYPSTISLFANTVLFLIVLTLLNGLIARWFDAALERGELLVIYAMLTVSTAIVSIDFLDVLVPMMTYPFRFATAENRWAQIILPHIPSWISVSDPDAVRGWYEGHTALDWAIIRHWLVPIGVWSSVILTMLAVMYCINTLVRQQWMESEKLLFPIVELPLQITEPNRRIFRSRLMWAGFAVAGGISILNGMQLFYPSLPALNVKMWDVSPLMPGRPWSAIGWTPISFYPYGIGLSFLLPLDMLFSCWFFYVSWRVIRIVGDVYGVYESTPTFPFMDQQALGSYYLVAVFALWSARRHLARIFRAAFRGQHDPDEANGPMRYRTAFLGIAVGLIVLTWFFQVIGMGWYVAAAVVVMYFFLALAIAKMHAEFGPPAHDLHGIGPEIVLIGALGPAAFNPQQLTAMNWLFWFNRAYRSIPIAYQLDAFKLAHRTDTPQRYMAIALGLASVAAVVSGFWIFLHFGYTRGASVGMAGHIPYFGMQAYSWRLHSWLVVPKPPDIPATLAIGWGMAFAYFLYFMKLRVGWWPFHPLGFAISTSYSIGTLWLPMFIAWLAKFLTLRYGGMKMYKTAMDFFIGLLLGDFIIGCLWPMVGWVLNAPTYSFMQ